MTAVQVQVARADTCSEPSHIVGFRIAHEKSGKSVFVDSFVPFSEVEGKSKEDIITIAYQKIKQTVEAFEKECEQQQDSLVGKTLDITTGRVV